VKQLNLDDSAVVAAVHVVEAMILALVIMLIWRVIEKYRNSDAHCSKEQVASTEQNVLPSYSGDKALEQMFIDASMSKKLLADVASDLSSELSPELSSEQLSEPVEESIASENTEDKPLDNYIDGFFGPPLK
jgi:hypothetical protein